MQTASVVKEVSYITKKGILKNSIIHFLVQFPQDLKDDFTPTNIQHMTNIALASLETGGDGGESEIKTRIFNAPIKDLHRHGYDALLTPEQKSLQLQHQVAQDPSLTQLLSSEIKQDDLIQMAQQCFEGPGKTIFLKKLTQLLQEASLENLDELLSGIRTGSVNGQELICNHDKEQHKVFYGLVLRVAKSRYQLSLSLLPCPWQDEILHRALDELRYCYTFGVGIPKNQNMVDQLDVYYSLGLIEKV